MLNQNDYSINQILKALPNEEYQRLVPHLEKVSFPMGYIIYETNKPILDVFFPHQTMISLLTVIKNEQKVEVAWIGNEGMLGLPVILGGIQTNTIAIVKIGDSLMKMDAQIFKEEFNRGDELQRIILRYTQARFTQISQNVACICHHTVEQRFARWLLSIQDYVQKNEFYFTQKFMSELLGVRRSSISEAASILQKKGIISYSRGNLTILDQAALKLITCECYETIQNNYIV